MTCETCDHKNIPECRPGCPNYQRILIKAEATRNGRLKEKQFLGYQSDHFDDYDHTPKQRRKGSYT